MGEFNVSKTMKVLFNEDKKIDYVVLKLGDQTFSTNVKEINQGKIKGNVQLVETKGIGEQHQIWIKGNFSEGKNHQKLEENKEFELNIYFHNPPKNI